MEIISHAIQEFLSPDWNRFRNLVFRCWYASVGIQLYSPISPRHDFLISSGQFGNRKIPPINIQLLAVIYFALFTIASYVLYAAKKEKG